MRPLFRAGPLLAAAFCMVSAFASRSAVAEPGYFRFPAVHGNTLVFTAEGDLWRAGLQGGEARRLTTHEGQETQAAISPDGHMLAFVASYAGAEDAYVMPVDGGPPKRLSFDGGRVQVHGWATPREVIYSSEDLAGPTLMRVIRLVDVDTLISRELPLHDANQAAFDDRGRVLFTRFGLHVNGDHAISYRGGAMAQLWLFDTRTGNEARRIGGSESGAMHTPMWHAGRWYFVSDRSGRDNLWSMAADGGELTPLTRHANFDVRGARLGSGRIVYQLGADLRVLDLEQKENQAIGLRLLSDFDARRQRWLERPLRFLESARLSATGDRIALTVRGRLALAGPGPQRRVEIATPADSRSREAVASADGRWIYAFNDASGRSEVWRFAADGSEQARQLTDDGTTHRWQLAPSPDGRWLAHTDKTGTLFLLDLDRGLNRSIDHSEWGGDDAYRDLVWSADSQALAFVRADSRAGRDQLLLHALASGRTDVLSSDRYESFAPAFSADGRWLYFLSRRHFVASPRSPWGDRNTGPGFDRRTKVYALALQSDPRFPFAPVDELRATISSDRDDTKRKTAVGPDSAASDPAKPLPAIQWEGLASRLYEVPLAAGNFEALGLDAKRLYLLEQSGERRLLKTLAIGNESAKLKDFAEHIEHFEVSADREKLALIQREGESDPTLLVVATGDKLPDDTSLSKVRSKDWRLPIDPALEWKQMFSDAWRMHREFSFDAGMRGQDWDAVRARYEPLLARVTERAELDDLLGQMISQLGILHSQVRGADLPEDVEAPKPAMLGAVLAQTADGLRIERIFRSDPELPSERSPLARPDVDARDGDLIDSVNGRPVRHAGDLAAVLHHQAGQQVLLGLRRDGRVRRTVVVPVDASTHARMRYTDWVHGRSEVVEHAAAGRIGYLHLRAMGPNDIASFVRDFYAQVEREGLIIDVRRNRGGNIDSWIIEKLLRREWAFWQSPGRKPYWNMQQTFRGHLAVLIDPLTYSDGETFAAGVKALGIAPLIGSRTAGAGIWLADRNRLSDGGIARIAEFGQFGSDGRWLIEGHGVQPDIEVDNLPHESWNGRDRQLEAAIDLLQQRLREAPIEQPPAQMIPPPGQTGRDVDSARFPLR
jgi:tricorn protease